ncbi:MAG TPA: prepilin-type N-terminal cleavage/methylation domain-containing protein [Stenomitos sp.]
MARPSVKPRAEALGQLWRLYLHFVGVPSPKGFALIEVMVALMVTMIFVSITMQMFVTAAFLRSKADQYNQAYNWIQEDYEGVVNKASQYEAGSVPFSPLCSATNPANGLAATFLSDAVNGLGGTTVTLGPKPIAGKTFTLTRVGDYATSDNPYKLLKLKYTVTATDGSLIAADLSTEVVLYAGLRCP